jgi:GT2 family glycosyltransferase
MKEPFVYILILNWNSWLDTLECLESVLRQEYRQYKVVVCDNHSTDNSIEKIKSWAKGELSIQIQQEHWRQFGLNISSVRKPIKYIEYKRSEAENGGIPADESRLILIHTGANLGFAGGNNVGLRYAMKRGDFSYVWLLNNDTVVQADALHFLVGRMENNPQVGMCGSTVLFYDTPEIVQTLGGATYNKWFGYARHIGYSSKINKSIGLKDQNGIERKMKYVLGASMLVSKDFLVKVGYMNQEYFLYFEEIDWAVRGARSGFKLGYAFQSVIYHKQGKSTNERNDPKKNLLSAFYLIKNIIVFTRNYCPWFLPTIYFGLLVTLFNRIRRGQRYGIGILIKLILGREVVL